MISRFKIHDLKCRRSFVAPLNQPEHQCSASSFGAVLYEMLSGRRAFRGDSAIETLNAILKEEPPELTSNPNITPALERVVWHCLEKSPERRFQSATDVAFALESLSGLTSHPSQQTTVAIPPPQSRWKSKQLIWMVAAVLFVLSFTAKGENSHRRLSC